MKASAFAWDPSKKLGGDTLIPLKELGLPWGLGGGLSDAPHIPARFQSFWRILVPFQQNLPAKISLLPQNFDILVISPEQSPKLTGMEWHWNPVTGMTTKNFQKW